MEKLIPNKTYRSIVNFAVLLATFGLALSWCIDVLAREIFRLALI